MPNNILRYTSRDYKSIRSDLTDAISSLSATWTSREEGDPGIVLVKLMSALGDMISFNFDKQALEYYSPTVTQRKNAARLFSFLAYQMHWYKAATTTITLTYTPPMDELLTYCKDVVDYPNNTRAIMREYLDRYFKTGEDEYGHPIYSSPEYFTPDSTDPEDIICINGNITDENLLKFQQVTTQYYKDWQQQNHIYINRYLGNPNVELGVYSSSYSEPVYSLEPTTNIKDDTYRYSSDGTETLYAYEPQEFKVLQGKLNTTLFSTRILRDNCFYIPDMNVDQDHLYLSYSSSSNGNTITFVDKVDNLLTTTDGKLHFQFGVDDYDYPYIELSSYWKEIVGEDSVTFTLYYFTTLGANGNITKDFLKEVQSIRSNNISVSNIENTEYKVNKTGDIICCPGFNPQTAHEAYKDALNWVTTYNTLVTPYDFTRFLKRQGNISNAYVYDKKTMRDVNTDLEELCNTYTLEQLQNILGSNVPGDKATLAKYLYKIRQLNYDYKDCPVTITEIQNDEQSKKEPKEFIPYHANFCPIVNNFQLRDGSSVPYAIKSNVVDDKVYPYYIYRIFTDNDNVPEEGYKIQTFLNKAMDEVHIGNIEPNYGAIRVFPWTLCGTVHLTKQVSLEESRNILNNIVSTVSEYYNPRNVKIGQKIDYMELIDIVMGADSRIRYFDAGIGDKKLVNFETISNSGGLNFFRTEAYFNAQSIMQFDATNTYSKGLENPTLMIDPEYIEKQVSESDIHILHQEE